MSEVLTYQCQRKSVDDLHSSYSQKHRAERLVVYLNDQNTNQPSVLDQPAWHERFLCPNLVAPCVYVHREFSNNAIWSSCPSQQ